MDLIEQILAGNQKYREESFTEALSHQPPPPRLQLAVVACMDARHVVERVFGLNPGDSLMIRTAGAVVDDAVLRSLVAGVHLLGVNTIIHLPHTDCGLKGLQENQQALYERVEKNTGKELDAKSREELLRWIQHFRDPMQHARDSMERIRIHSLIPDYVNVYGFVYDNKTGTVTPVPDTPQSR
jgi:carbonic anhydrase